MFQKTIKNFSIHVNALNERNTVSPGDLLTGNVCFELTKNTKISAITMDLLGRVHVNWSTSTGKKRGRRSVSAKIDFFSLRSVLLQEDAGQAVKLPPGVHVYPFTCQFPQGDFPSSFRGVCGHISYTLTVSVHRPWHLAKDTVTQLNFGNPVNPNQPVLWAPLSGSNSTTLCCPCWDSGPITMTASLPKKAFTPGERVKITCKFSNASSRTVTPKVKLQQKQSFYTHNKVNKCFHSKTLASLSGQPVGARASAIDTDICITIPNDAPPTIANCCLLEVEYTIELSLSTRAAYDLTVLFPIAVYPQTSPPS